MKQLNKKFVIENAILIQADKGKTIVIINLMHIPIKEIHF